MYIAPSRHLGVVVYIRSFQCSGAGLLETGISTGSNVITTTAVVLADAVNGQESLSEAMTGNGADYRGGQRYTRPSRGSFRGLQGCFGPFPPRFDVKWTFSEAPRRHFRCPGASTPASDGIRTIRIP